MNHLGQPILKLGHICILYSSSSLSMFGIFGMGPTETQTRLLFLKKNYQNKLPVE
jgi:hypothetical protein